MPKHMLLSFTWTHLICFQGEALSMLSPVVPDPVSYMYSNGMMRILSKVEARVANMFQPAERASPLLRGSVYATLWRGW